ncbi:MAG: DNA mismatch repair protein MutH [Candidatus Eisenbacteria bacterium]
MAVIDKGRIGKLLEHLIGLPPGARLTDLDDAELKTNKSFPDGRPKETMFIMQLATYVDELLFGGDFEESRLHRKIRRLLYVPVVKEGDRAEWFFLRCYDVKLEPGTDLYGQLNADYDSIRSQAVELLKTRGDGLLHTCSGELMQVRTKDGKPYHPIYSSVLERPISNKNFAFYFKKEFMYEIQRRFGPPTAAPTQRI